MLCIVSEESVFIKWHTLSVWALYQIALLSVCAVRDRWGISICRVTHLGSFFSIRLGEQHLSEKNRKRIISLQKFSFIFFPTFSPTLFLFCFAWVFHPLWSYWLMPFCWAHRHFSGIGRFYVIFAWLIFGISLLFPCFSGGRDLEVRIVNFYAFLFSVPINNFDWAIDTTVTYGVF